MNEELKKPRWIEEMNEEWRNEEVKNKEAKKPRWIEEMKNELKNKEVEEWRSQEVKMNRRNEARVN